MTSNQSLPFELPTNLDGSENPKYVDLLDEDKPISGQKFACVSFISPENIIKHKECFFFSEFLKNWDFSKSMEKYTQFLHFVAYKYNLEFDDLVKDLGDFIKEEKGNLEAVNVESEYKTFLDNHEEKLNEAYNSENAFVTNTRGLKIRGSFPTQEEAELRCQLLRQIDPNHNIYVGPVGQWIPWEPTAYKTGRVEYLNPELNKLMSEKKNNQEQVDVEFQKRVREAKEKAIKENMKIAKESGNKLTQNIDSAGNLFSVNQSNTEVSVADIRKELFENENVVKVDDPNNDRGLSQLKEIKKQNENQVIELNENVGDQSTEHAAGTTAENSGEVTTEANADTKKGIEFTIE